MLFCIWVILIPIVVADSISSYLSMVPEESCQSGAWYDAYYNIGALIVATDCIESRLKSSFSLIPSDDFQSISVMLTAYNMENFNGTSFWFSLETEDNSSNLIMFHFDGQDGSRELIQTGYVLDRRHGEPTTTNFDEDPLSFFYSYTIKFSKTDIYWYAEDRLIRHSSVRLDSRPLFLYLSFYYNPWFADNQSENDEQIIIHFKNLQIMM